MAARTEPPYNASNPEVHEFGSWGSYLDYVQNAPANVAPANRSSRERGADSWTGNADWSKAVKLATEGWTEGEARVAKLSRHLEARVLHRIVREDINYDVEGMQFDTARYLEGEPEHWIKNEESTTLTDAGSKHVKLVVNISASSGVSGDVITGRGAAIAALVELLEYADHHVELWVFDAAQRAPTRGDGSNDRPIHVVAIRVKAFDQPVDMGRIAFACAHPAMLRRFAFSAMECAHPSIVEYVTHRHSYGMPSEARNAFEHVSIYLPGCKLWDSSCDWTSPEAAETWILAKLAEQGIILRDA